MSAAPYAHRYDARSAADILRLVTGQPLAWVVAAGTFSASLLPLRPSLAPDGALEAFRGHFAGTNPLVEAFRADPRALILVLGPHGYVSPRHGGDPAQAPTWNYASVQFVAEVTLVEDEAATEAHLSDLAGALEADAAEPWTLAAMGPRYASLASRIAPFRAEILETRPRFKLGQDERADIFAGMLEGLEAMGREDLTAWMRRYRD